MQCAAHRPILASQSSIKDLLPNFIVLMQKPLLPNLSFEISCPGWNSFEEAYVCFGSSYIPLFCSLMTSDSWLSRGTLTCSAPLVIRGDFWQTAVTNSLLIRSGIWVQVKSCRTLPWNDEISDLRFKCCLCNAVD